MTKTRAIQFRLTKILTSILFSKIWRPHKKPRPLTQPPKRNQKKSTLVNSSSKRRKKILIKLRPVTGLLSISANHWLRQFKIFNMSNYYCWLNYVYWIYLEDYQELCFDSYYLIINLFLWLVIIRQLLVVIQLKWLGVEFIQSNL